MLSGIKLVIAKDYTVEYDIDYKKIFVLVSKMAIIRPYCSCQDKEGGPFIDGRSRCVFEWFYLNGNLYEALSRPSSS